jgi:hypothetical protein
MNRQLTALSASSAASSQRTRYALWWPVLGASLNGLTGDLELARGCEIEAALGAGLMLRALLADSEPARCGNFLLAARRHEPEFAQAAG